MNKIHIENHRLCRGLYFYDAVNDVPGVSGVS